MGKIKDARWLAAQAKKLLAKNDAKVKEALDKAAGVVDSRTKGKYSDKIEGAVSKAKTAVDKLPDRASAAEGPASGGPASGAEAAGDGGQSASRDEPPSGNAGA